MSGAVLNPCIVVGVVLFYSNHCDLEKLLTDEKCLTDVLSIKAFNTAIKKLCFF